ncbi:ABC transporter substrate-binding protein [Tissierella praeacuta]|uniref:ABC transporter substrate-binding protein n=1 Tax=Tissierella praeacuta TaxID=43131 RepID=UPI00333E9986
MKKLSLFLAIILCLGLFTGCAKKNESMEAGKGENAEHVESALEVSKEPKEGGVFIASMGGEPRTYNPDGFSDDGAYPIIQNVFNKLVKINGYDEIIPDLAKKWEFSEDETAITFYLQENVKWHDGKDFSSEDVKWTFDQIIKEEGFAANSLSDIKEVTCPDKNTVVIKLEGPNSGILGYIAWFGTYIMPKHIYEGTDWLENPANQNPIGTGPFKFVEHKKGESVTIERNNDYWGDKPYLDKVIFSIIPEQSTAYQAWLNGETDENKNGVPANEISRFENDENYVIYDKLWPNKGYIHFNMNKGKFADLKVRQAVAYGIDRDEIFTKALKEIGEKSEYFISPLYDWALNKDAKLPERDIEKAKSLLEEAGYKADSNGIYFTTTVDIYPGFEDVVEVLKSNFKEFGIDLKVNAMDDSSYDEKVWFGHDFELTMLGGYQGPDISAIGNRFGTGSVMNLGEYNNPRMDELLEQGVIPSKKEERAPIYKEMQTLLAEDLPAIFLYEKGAKIVVKSYVKGHPAGEAVEKASESEYTYIWLDK